MGKEKVHINIVFIGHVDSEKSTIVDHFTHKLGGIDKSVIEKFDKEPAEINKLSSKYAWVLDKLKSERESGITNDIALSMFETTKYYCTVIDATGHEDIKDIISNLSQADCAVLVIDPTTSDILPRQHALLASISGVKQRMDVTTPKYSRDRYKEIGNNFTGFFMRVGYNPCEIPFIPISDFDGDNLIEPSTNIGWYNGLTLLEALDRIKKPKRPSTKTMMKKDPGALAHAVRDRFLSICTQLQRETMVMEDLSFLSEGQNSMFEFPADSNKDFISKIEKEKADWLSQLKKDDMLINNMKQIVEQYAPKDGEAGSTKYLSKNQRKKMKIQPTTRTNGGYNTRSKGV